MKNKNTEFTPAEHPFAQYIRILGKGKTGSRSLSEADAFDAMSMLLAGDIQPEQLGAFLMLLRVKEETAEELSGFAAAARKTIKLPDNLNVQLDWPTYAGKRLQPPWYLLAAFALANSGVRVLMHGAAGHTPGRVYTEDVLFDLGLPAIESTTPLDQLLNRLGFAFLPLRVMNPELDRVIKLKPLLGLRSPVHSLCRLINPADSAHSVQSVFHPSYAAVHQQAAIRLGSLQCVIGKGDGGEFEMRPTADSTLHRVCNGKAATALIPRRLQRYDGQDDVGISGSAARLRRFWESADEVKGEANSRVAQEDASYAEPAVLATLQACLLALKPQLSVEQAGRRALKVWRARNVTFLAEIEQTAE